MQRFLCPLAIGDILVCTIGLDSLTLIILDDEETDSYIASLTIGIDNAVFQLAAVKRVISFNGFLNLGADYRDVIRVNEALSVVS
jgi:hypothetical protein